MLDKKLSSFLAMQWVQLLKSKACLTPLPNKATHHEVTKYCNHPKMDNQEKAKFKVRNHQDIFRSQMNLKCNLTCPPWKNEQIISCSHYKDHQLQKRLNALLSMHAVRLDNQRQAGKYAHLPPIVEQTRENSRKSSLAFKEDPIGSPWNSRSFDV